MGATWTKDGDPFDQATAPDRRVSLNSTGITIDPVRPQDEGVYRCNNGTPLELTTPPHRTQREVQIMMKELGSNFSLPCGIRLGRISRSKTFTITWQQIGSNNGFVTLTSCTHTGTMRPRSAQHSSSCTSDDFSLSIHNFGESGDIDLPKQQVRYKCTVDLSFHPSVSRLGSQSGDAFTTVRFRYDPPRVVTELPPYTVTQIGDSVPLEIEFEGYPLSPGGIQWEINSYGVPKSLSVDTATSSSVVLSGDSLELGDIVTATVNVFDTSTASTASTVVVIPFIDDIIVTRSTQCNVPVIRFNIPAPIPIPRGTPTSPTVQLHIEYTRIDTALAVGDPDSVEREVFEKQYNADTLTQNTHMEMSVESLPYPLISWEIYVLRVRLEILGVVSNQWSPYSRPLCIRCEECLNPPSVEINLQLTFPRNTFTCSSTVLKQGLTTELAQAIRESCPEYLCQDLVFTEAELSCSETDGTQAQFSALVSGIGVQEYVRAFLNNIATQQRPLSLNIHGTSVEATPMDPPTSPMNGVGRIAGPSGLVVVLALAALMLACLVWHCKRRSNKESCSASTDQRQGHCVESEASEHYPTSDQLPQSLSPPAPDQLPSSTFYPEMFPHLTTANLGICPMHLPHPLTPDKEAAILHSQSAHRHTHHTHHFTPSPSPHTLLTMNEAGNLVQTRESTEDTMDLSNYTHSETNFMFEGPRPPRRNSLTSATPSQNHKTPTHLPSREMFIPLSPAPSCSCSCHSTPVRSSSPSVPLIEAYQRRPAMLQQTLQVSSTSCLPSDDRHHYKLWIDRGQIHRQQHTMTYSAGSPV